MENWHEDDDFWERTAPFMFSEQLWESAPTEVAQIMALLEVEPGTSILDMCCGPGRHSLEWARRGYHVTGVDRTSAYLEQAQQRAGEEGLTIQFVQEDMRRFCKPNAFDGATMMFTSFGYFEDPAENRQVLTNLYRSLKDRGTLIVDVMGKEVLSRIFRERDWSEHNDAFLLQEREVSRNWSWMENRWILLGDGERYEARVTHWIYSAAELSDMLKECGFGRVKVYGDFEGAPYDRQAKRLIAAAYKR